MNRIVLRINRQHLVASAGTPPCGRRAVNVAWCRPLHYHQDQEVRDKPRGGRRRRNNMRMLRIALMLCAGMAPVPAVAAEAWPTRPIKLVVPFSAAGTADL